MTRARGMGVLAALTLLAYAQAPRASFQFDDWNVILRDPAALSLAGWWSRMPGIRPLLKLSYALGAELGLGSPGFHVINVAIHLGCSALVFLLLESLARIHGLGGAEPGAARAGAGVLPGVRAPRAALAALAGSLVFALHPVQTEAVTYACGRSVSLAALFALGSVVAWIEGRERGRSLIAYAVSPALAAAAIATKEFTLVILPALLLLVLCDPRRERRRGEAARVLAAHGPVVMAGLLAILASPVYRRLLATSLAIRDIGTNLRTQASAIVWLGGQLVRPDRLNADPKLPIVTSWTPASAAAAAVLAALLLLGAACVRRRPALALGILWVFLWLGPTNSFLPRLDVANDRQLYVAIIGPAWIVGLAIARMSRDAVGSAGGGGRAEDGNGAGVRAGAMSPRRAFLSPRPAGATVVLGAVLLGAMTFARNRVYVTEIGFWEDVVVKSPHNARAHNNLGYAYALVCRREDADRELSAAVRLDPSDYTAPINLSMLRDGSLPGYREACGGPGSGPSTRDR